MQMPFNRMANEQAVKGKSVLVSLLTPSYEIRHMPRNIFFQLYDRKISPVLLYGSEIWGFARKDAIELVQRYACKRYMCVRRR